jgi:hypothetical protein
MLEGIDTNRIWDPSGNRIIGGVNGNTARSFLFTYPSDNWVKYSGFDLNVESRPTPNLDIFATYTLGWTWGTAITQNAFQSPGSQYDNPRYRQYYIGYIPEGDVRHTIRSQVTYNLRGVNLGATFTYQSGFALRKTYTGNANVLTTTVRGPFGIDPGAPPGTSGLNDYRNWSEFRTPDTFQITLLVGYDFYELLRQHLLFTVGIENLFDNLTPGGLGPFIKQSESAPPSNFGYVTGRPAPFRVQLGLRYSY